MNARDYKNIFNYHGRGLYAWRRIIETFKELHLFDLRRSVNTTEIKTDGYSDPRYMIYMPVYTSVCNEMIRKSVEWYTAAIRYTNENLIPIFVDLGAGSGKTVILANESKFFEMCVGVELQEELSKRSKENLPNRTNNTKRKEILGTNVLHLNANVESDNWVKEILKSISEERHSDIVLFAFNKNSYDDSVVCKTLKIIKKNFQHSMYLYQNPVHHSSIIENGYAEVQRDAAPNNAHKNLKYVIYQNLPS